MLSRNIAFLRACENLGVKLRCLSDEWVVEMDFGEKKKYAIGGHLGLNSDVAMRLARDKVAAAKVLADQGVPVVMCEYVGEESEIAWEEWNFGEEVVVKPNCGFGGKGVKLCIGTKAAEEAIKEILEGDRAACVSKYEWAKCEYRCFYLDGKIVAMYGKEPQSGEWRHNLSSGAKVIMVESQAVKELAERAGKALGMTFVTVDILETDNGLKVLEVNSSVDAKHLLEQKPEMLEPMVVMYEEALKYLRSL